MKNRPLVMLCLVFLCVRYFIFWAGTDRRFPPEILKVDSKQIHVNGQIYKKENREKGPLWYLRTKDKAFIVYGSEEENYRVGNRIAVTGTFQLFESASNPGTFDSRSYYQNQNIYGMIFPKKITLTDSKIKYGKEELFSLRERWKEEILRRTGKEGGVLCGILLGDKSALNPEIKELYQKNGIAHLLAVSGLHVSFIGMVFFRCARKMGMPFWVSAAAGILVLLPYAVMTGLSISAQRAVLMYLIRMGAEVTGRVYDLPTSLAVSAAVILGIAPKSVFDAGFQLSFGALLAIWSGDALKVHIKKEVEDQRIKRWKLVNLVMPGVCIQILTFPVLLTSYYEFPLYSVLVNIWVIPLMSVVMGSGLLGSICCLIAPGLADRIFMVSKAVLVFYEWNCRIMLKLPGARIIIGKPDEIQIVLYLLLLTGTVWFLWKGRKRAGIFVLAAALLILLFPWKKMSAEMEITMLDVGQGDGIYIRTPGGLEYLIDGGSTSKDELSRYTLEPFLESRGIAKLDYVLISHGDEDHIGGIQEMLERKKLGIQIRTLVLPEKRFWNKGIERLVHAAQNAGTKVKIMKEGNRISDSKGACLTCLGPSASYQGESGNEASMILKFDYQKFSMLFTGDLEGDGERAFLQGKNGSGNYTILKTAHHGADGSTSEDFLRMNGFSYALISVGEDNPYGHPGKQLLKRLEKYDIKIFCTKDTGAVTIKCDGRKMTVRKFLE